MAGISTRKWKKDVRRGVEALGITVVSITADHRKHLRMVCQHGGREWNQTLSVSPSSPVALQMAVREAQRFRDQRGYGDHD